MRRRLGARAGRVSLVALAGVIGAGAIAVMRPAPVMATQIINITDGTTTSLLGIQLSKPQCGSVQAYYCFSPASISASTGERVVWVNNSTSDQGVTGHGGTTTDSVSLFIPKGAQASASFPLADRITYNVNAGEGGTIDVTGNPVTSGTGPGPGPAASTPPPPPGQVTGAAAAKPTVVVATPAAPHLTAVGPQGSSALPPVTSPDPAAEALPSPDAGSLPPILVPSPKPRSAPPAASTSSGLFGRLGQRQTLYLSGAALFVLVVIVSTVVYLVRRGKQKVDLVPL